MEVSDERDDDLPDWKDYQEIGKLPLKIKNTRFKSSKSSDNKSVRLCILHLG